MSALPPVADIGTQPRNVRFVPKADITTCYISTALGGRNLIDGDKGNQNENRQHGGLRGEAKCCLKFWHERTVPS
jgi:hypothetical protein